MVVYVNDLKDPRHKLIEEIGPLLNGKSSEIVLDTLLSLVSDILAETIPLPEKDINLIIDGLSEQLKEMTRVNRASNQLADFKKDGGKAS